MYDFVTTYGVAPAPNVKNDLDHVLDMALGVYTPRNCQPHQIHAGMLAEHERTDLYRADPAFQIQLYGQRHSRKLRGGNVFQKRPRINIYSVAAGRLDNGYSFLRNAIAQKRRRSDAIPQVVLVQCFI